MHVPRVMLIMPVDYMWSQIVVDVILFSHMITSSLSSTANDIGLQYQHFILWDFMFLNSILYKIIQISNPHVIAFLLGNMMVIII